MSCYSSIISKVRFIQTLSFIYFKKPQPLHPSKNVPEDMSTDLQPSLDTRESAIALAHVDDDESSTIEHVTQAPQHTQIFEIHCSRLPTHIFKSIAMDMNNETWVAFGEMDPRGELQFLLSGAYHLTLSRRRRKLTITQHLLTGIQPSC